MLPSWGQQTVGQGQEATTERSQFGQSSNGTLPKSWSTQRPREHLGMGHLHHPFHPGSNGLSGGLSFSFCRWKGSQLKTREQLMSRQRNHGQWIHSSIPLLTSNCQKLCFVDGQGVYVRI